MARGRLEASQLPVLRLTCFAAIACRRPSVRPSSRRSARDRRPNDRPCPSALSTASLQVHKRMKARLATVLVEAAQRLGFLRGEEATGQFQRRMAPARALSTSTPISWSAENAKTTQCPRVAQIEMRKSGRLDVRFSMFAAGNRRWQVGTGIGLQEPTELSACHGRDRTRRKRFGRPPQPEMHFAGAQRLDPVDPFEIGIPQWCIASADPARLAAAATHAGSTGVVPPLNAARA